MGTYTTYLSLFIYLSYVTLSKTPNSEDQTFYAEDYPHGRPYTSDYTVVFTEASIEALQSFSNASSVHSHRDRRSAFNFQSFILRFNLNPAVRPAVRLTVSF